jgi:hypothetical protein
MIKNYPCTHHRTKAAAMTPAELPSELQESESTTQTVANPTLEMTAKAGGATATVPANSATRNTIPRVFLFLSAIIEQSACYVTDARPEMYGGTGEARKARLRVAAYTLVADVIGHKEHHRLHAQLLPSRPWFRSAALGTLWTRLPIGSWHEGNAYS